MQRHDPLTHLRRLSDNELLQVPEGAPEEAVRAAFEQAWDRYVTRPRAAFGALDEGSRRALESLLQGARTRLSTPAARERGEGEARARGAGAASARFAGVSMLATEPAMLTSMPAMPGVGLPTMASMASMATMVPGVQQPPLPLSMAGVQSLPDSPLSRVSVPSMSTPGVKPAIADLSDPGAGVGAVDESARRGSKGGKATKRGKSGGKTNSLTGLEAVDALLSTLPSARGGGTLAAAGAGATGSGLPAAPNDSIYESPELSAGVDVSLGGVSRGGASAVDVSVGGVSVGGVHMGSVPPNAARAVDEGDVLVNEAARALSSPDGESSDPATGERAGLQPTTDELREPVAPPVRREGASAGVAQASALAETVILPPREPGVAGAGVGAVAPTPVASYREGVGAVAAVPHHAEAVADDAPADDEAGEREGELGARGFDGNETEMFVDEPTELGESWFDDADEAGFSDDEFERSHSLSEVFGSDAPAATVALRRSGEEHSDRYASRSVIEPRPARAVAPVNDADEPGPAPIFPHHSRGTTRYDSVPSLVDMSDSVRIEWAPTRPMPRPVIDPDAEGFVRANPPPPNPRDAIEQVRARAAERKAHDVQLPPLSPEQAVDGTLLKKLRELKGLSLDEVLERTHISRRHLESLEADRFKQLPPRVYVQGYLKMLARELGVDEKLLVEGYLRTYDRG